MCARYTMVTPADELIEEFEATLTFEGLRPRYNIAPTQEAPIVVSTRGGERRLGLARFGLVPQWAEEARVGLRMLNARVETVATSRAYRGPFRSRRCLVVADGFYEWRREGRRRIPHRFHLGGRPFGMAGLWSTWRPPGGGAPMASFTILTRDAVGPVAEVHGRMPILLPREAYGAWLDRAPRAPGALLELLEAHLGEALLATRVTERVNSPRHDDPSLLEPLEPGAP